MVDTERDRLDHIIRVGEDATRHLQAGFPVVPWQVENFASIARPLLNQDLSSFQVVILRGALIQVQQGIRMAVGALERASQEQRPHRLVALTNDEQMAINGLRNAREALAALDRWKMYVVT